MTRRYLNQGYTFIEASLVMAVLAILMTLSTVSLLGVQEQSFVHKSFELLLSDMKQQQAYAMSGRQNNAGVQSASGVYFGTDSYTLFDGDTYLADAPENFTTTLENGLEFGSIAGKSIVFAKGSGEIVNYSESLETIDITRSDKTNPAIIQINELGVITNIQP